MTLLYGGAYTSCLLYTSVFAVVAGHAQGDPQTQRLWDLPGVPDFVEHGALLVHLWMEGQLGVGDPVVDQGSPTRPLRAHKS